MMNIRRTPQDQGSVELALLVCLHLEALFWTILIHEFLKPLDLKGTGLEHDCCFCSRAQRTRALWP